MSLPKPCSDILVETLKRFLSEGKKSFYIEDLVKESKVSLNFVEAYLIPLLKKDRLEGKLEVRCPRCRRDQGLFDRIGNIPSQLTCDVCDLEFPVEREDLQIVLEVKGDFFRTRNNARPIEFSGIPTKQDLVTLLEKSLRERAVVKGREFERFFQLLMCKEKNFEYSFTHPRTRTGEIDFVYKHTMKDPFWDLSPYVCIECKNWTDNIASVQMGHLGNLVKDKFPLSCIGVYLTTSAYDPSAYETIKEFRNMHKIILIPVEGKHIKDMIEKGFEKFTKEVCEYTVFKRKKP